MPRKRTDLIALAFFCLLTALATWPLILHMSDRVPGWFVADNYEYLWKMWWFKHALLDLGQSPLTAPDIFYPQGFALAHAELTPLHTVLGLPITWAFGEIFAYNLFALLSFIVSGWAAYRLTLDLTGELWAGLLSGTLFVLAPYHTVRYGGILPLMAVQGIPLFFLGLQRWNATRRWPWGLLAGLGYLLSSWASPYYGFGLAILGSLCMLIQLRPLRTALRQRATWQLALLLGGSALMALIPLALPYWQLSKEIELIIPLEEVDFWSASFSDYLLPPGLHPLWGDFVRQRLLAIPPEYPQIALEFVLAPGWIALIFAVMGARSRADARGEPNRRAYLWLTATALILSFGPRLHLARHPLLIPAPQGLTDIFDRAMNTLGAWLPSGEGFQDLSGAGLSLPLPALLLRWLLPPLRGLRAWNRFAAFVSLGVAVLAGLGLSAWIKREVAPPTIDPARAARRTRLAGAVVLALAIFELWPGAIPLQQVRPRAVDLWLAKQPGKFSIMELPLTSALSAPQMLYTRYHGKRITFAYGTYFPIWYRRAFPELMDCPDQACLDRLRGWEVRYLLLNREAVEPGARLEHDLGESPAFQRVVELEGMVVYQLTGDG